MKILEESRSIDQDKDAINKTLHTDAKVEMKTKNPEEAWEKDAEVTKAGKLCI